LNSLLFIFFRNIVFYCLLYDFFNYIWILLFGLLLCITLCYLAEGDNLAEGDLADYLAEFNYPADLPDLYDNWEGLAGMRVGVSKLFSGIYGFKLFIYYCQFTVLEF